MLATYPQLSSPIGPLHSGNQYERRRHEVYEFLLTTLHPKQIREYKEVDRGDLKFGIKTALRSSHDTVHILVKRFVAFSVHFPSFRSVLHA